ncbi:MAG: type VI secretion system tip protein TssI/VgrG [Minicystis sp.]
MSTEKPLLYWFDLAGRTFAVKEVKGREAMSRPFHFEIRFVVDEGEPIAPASVLKKEASLKLERSGVVRTVDGIVTDFKIRMRRTGAPEAVAVLEPRLVLARYRSDLHIFREKTVPEIVCEVLATIGVTPELRLKESYERRHYCVQFRETDFDFVNRLMEHEGISYFFLEGDVMVMMDNAASYEPLPGIPVVPYRAGAGLDHNQDCITSVKKRAALAANKVTLRDFNPEKPRLDMDVEATVPSPSGAEWYDYPGEYTEPSRGARKAKIIAESFACAAAGLHGTSFCGRIFPGAKLTIIDAPRLADGEHVITAVEHDFVRENDGFSNRFEALDAETTFRALLDTPEPRILNPLSGFVTGPAGEDIYTDEWGRVKVHFHWDRRQPLDEECSFWIPVLQDNTGHSAGIPRIGWEVLVEFLEGDPDRPVVLGRVYNAEDTFPHELPLRKTRSALRSQSSPVRKGTNEIYFEDLAGMQHIFVHAERDQQVLIANDKRELVYNNETHSIHRDESITIGRDTTVKIGAPMSQEVGANQRWKVDGSRKRQVAKADSARVNGDRRIEIDGQHSRRIGTNDQVKAQNLTEKVGGAILETSKKTNYTQGERHVSLTVGGAKMEIAEKDRSETTNEDRTEEVGADSIVTAGKEIATRVDTVRKTTVDGALKVTAHDQIAMSGVEKLSMKADQHEVSGTGSLTLKVQDTKIVMKDGAVTIVTKSAIKMIVTGDNQQGADNSTQI